MLNLLTFKKKLKMIKAENFRFLAGLCFLALCTICFNACGDDDVEGCTDAAADNYNPEATVSDGSCVYSGCTDPDAENYDPQATNDDGSCVYARDKFIGSYFGGFTCPGLLAIISSDSIFFSVAEGLDADKKNEVIVTLNNVGGLTLDLTATAEGDQLLIEAELLGVPISGVTGNVVGSGTAVLDSTGDEITATLELTVSVPLLGINDTQTCTLVGERQ